MTQVAEHNDVDVPVVKGEDNKLHWRPDKVVRYRTFDVECWDLETAYGKERAIQCGFAHLLRADRLVTGHDFPLSIW